MALERTFSIVKPDATKRNLVGQIVAKFEEGGLRVVAQKRIQLTLAQAQQFYGVSIDFLSSGYLDVSVPRVCS